MQDSFSVFATWMRGLAAASVAACAALVSFDRSAADEDWLDPAGIRGALVICGGGTLPPTVLDDFRKLAGGAAAKLVVIPTASERSDQTDVDPAADERWWRERGFSNVVVLHAASREQAAVESFAQPLRDATAVWFGGGQQSRLSDRYLGTPVEHELTALLQRGGVIGGTSAGAAIQSRVMIASGNPVPNIAAGFDLLPGAIIDQHYRQRNRPPRLAAAVEQHPRCFGVGVDEGTAVVVTGREMTVRGEQAVTIHLAATAGRPARDLELRDGDRADLTALRRAARARAGNVLAAPPSAPNVPSGSLIIAGGGALPDEIVNKFLELAGGPSARIVVLPTAAAAAVSAGDSEAALFTRRGAGEVTVLPARRRDEVDSDSFREAVQAATGVWFGGGRQWRFVDAYAETVAVELFREVLRRGGVIGGSSAGASIQAEYLARGSPLGNEEFSAEGYERGLGFLPGVAVDQHFTQRQRLPDLLRFVAAQPKYLGIGVDEQTALLVRGGTAEILGRNVATFVFADQDQVVHALTVGSGGRFDLAARRVEAAGGDE